MITVKVRSSLWVDQWVMIDIELISHLNMELSLILDIGRRWQGRPHFYSTGDSFFCFENDVQFHHNRMLRWNGQKMKEKRLTVDPFFCTLMSFAITQNILKLLTFPLWEVSFFTDCILFEHQKMKLAIFPFYFWKILFVLHFWVDVRICIAFNVNYITWNWLSLFFLIF